MATRKVEPLIEPVVFCSNKLNVRIQVKGGVSETDNPAGATHPDTKFAVFSNGLFQTDDPEVVTFLDGLNYVWRLDDPTAGLKTELGVDEFQRLRGKFAALGSSSGEPEDSNEPLSERRGEPQENESE